MLTFLQDLKLTTLQNMPSSGMRWFYPTEAFWQFLSRFPGVTFIDVGTGAGDLPVEATLRGIKMLGLDPRPSRNPITIRCLGETYGYRDSSWAMTCRPCHDGFSAAVKDKALSDGAAYIYVGLSSNLHEDVGDDVPDVCVPLVGEEGESLYLYLPEGSTYEID